MILEPNVEQLLDKSKAINRFELVIVISKRARQLDSGEVPKVNTKELSEITIASLEFADEKYGIQREYVEE